ncbi:DUF4292 domain-containing protein [Pedobacter immunditicola]|uniref:DUF4292 domain-containing protein n=1 Tax=Pedobacter immunditicola TaxID=3133440 RepID=UPI0030AE736C
MIANNYKLLFLGMVILTFSACKSKKLVVAPPVVKVDTVNTGKAENLLLLKNNNINFLTLSLTGKAQLNMDGQENNVSVNIRILKDKKIWMRVSAIANMEIARVLVTPDSLLVLNRMQGVVLQKPFNYIHTYANREVNFKLLQDLLTGNAPDEFLGQDADLELQNGVWLLKGTRNNLGFQILFNTLLKAAQTNLNHASAAQALKVVYGDYQKVNGSLFPSGMQLNSMSGAKKVDITFDFSKIESNVTLDFPFTVPKRFEVLN